jgi:hypothetical protein
MIPTNEAIDAFAGWSKFERVARELGDAYVKIDRSHPTALPFDARLSVDDHNMVRFEWTNYFNDGSRDIDEIEFPMEWLWDADWEHAARAQHDAKVLKIRDQLAAAELARITKQLETAQRNMDEALAAARRHGVLPTQTTLERNTDEDLG